MRKFSMHSYVFAFFFSNGARKMENVVRQIWRHMLTHLCWIINTRPGRKVYDKLIANRRYGEGMREEKRGKKKLVMCSIWDVTH